MKTPTAHQRIAILALADGQSPEAAAEAAEVKIRTVRRWMSDPDFMDAVTAADDLGRRLVELWRDVAACCAGLPGDQDVAAWGAVLEGRAL